MLLANFISSIIKAEKLLNFSSFDNNLLTETMKQIEDKEIELSSNLVCREMIAFHGSFSNIFSKSSDVHVALDRQSDHTTIAHLYISLVIGLLAPVPTFTVFPESDSVVARGLNPVLTSAGIVSPLLVC